MGVVSVWWRAFRGNLIERLCLITCVFHNYHQHPSSFVDLSQPNEAPLKLWIPTLYVLGTC